MLNPDVQYRLLIGVQVYFATKEKISEAFANYAQIDTLPASNLPGHWERVGASLKLKSFYCLYQGLIPTKHLNFPQDIANSDLYFTKYPDGGGHCFWPYAAKGLRPNLAFERNTMGNALTD